MVPFAFGWETAAPVTKAKADTVTRPPTQSASDLPASIDGPLAVIGDLHGAVDLLARLLDRLRQWPSFEKRWIVFTGDFLDRGPQPKATLQCVLALRDGHGKVTACMGNHDLALVGALGLIRTPAASNWNLRYVADHDAYNTFASYGVPIAEREFDQLVTGVHEIQPYYDPSDWQFANGEVPSELRTFRDDTLNAVEARLAQLREYMPERHKQFLAGLPWCIEHPRYLVVHAGLEPDEPFEKQLEVLRARDFNHGRPPWLHEKGLAGVVIPADCPLVVVSGHTMVPEVWITQGGRRILVDTFGGHGSVLSAVLLPELEVITSDG